MSIYLGEDGGTRRCKPRWMQWRKCRGRISPSNAPRGTTSMRVCCSGSCATSAAGPAGPLHDARDFARVFAMDLTRIRASRLPSQNHVSGGPSRGPRSSRGKQKGCMHVCTLGRLCAHTHSGRALRAHVGAHWGHALWRGSRATSSAHDSVHALGKSRFAGLDVQPRTACTSSVAMAHQMRASSSTSSTSTSGHTPCTCVPPVMCLSQGWNRRRKSIQRRRRRRAWRGPISFPVTSRAHQGCPLFGNLGRVDMGVLVCFVPPPCPFFSA